MYVFRCVYVDCDAACSVECALLFTFAFALMLSLVTITLVLITRTVVWFW